MKSRGRGSEVKKSWPARRSEWRRRRWRLRSSNWAAPVAVRFGWPCRRTQRGASPCRRRCKRRRFECRASARSSWSCKRFHRGWLLESSRCGVCCCSSPQRRLVHARASGRAWFCGATPEKPWRLVRNGKEEGLSNNMNACHDRTLILIGVVLSNPQVLCCNGVGYGWMKLWPA